MKKVIVIGVIILMIGYLIPFSLVWFNKDSKINQQIDYLIVLGAKVNGFEPSATLSYRLDKAVEFHNENPDIMIVVTGGQGPDELYTEAQVMQNYLIEAGVNKTKIVVEDKSTTTFENLSNAKELMGEGNVVGVVTNDFHIFRSSIICKRVFEQKCEMLSAKNYAGFAGVYSLLREPFALYKTVFFDR